MDDILGKIVDLISKANDDQDVLYTIDFKPSAHDIALLKFLKETGCVEQIICDSKVADVDEIVEGTLIKCEIVPYELQQHGYFLNVKAFVNTHEFSAPEKFYIKELQFQYPKSVENEVINSYFTIIKLATCISSLARFVSEEPVKTAYLIQDKLAVAVPLIYDNDVIQTSNPKLDNIQNFVEEINAHTERKKIFTKELIDFLLEETEEDKRFSYLFGNFDKFYQKCEAAYAFFLSDFSYSKLKLELESAILDYSKNIRAIINDSQTKLIAIPAAFIIGSTQLDLENGLSLKNFLITTSSFVFSILIEIFLRNQESSVKIFKDNISNYKLTFSLKNLDHAEKEAKTLQSIIKISFQAIDEELRRQFSRLKLIRIINWGTSVFLILIVVGLIMSTTLKTYNLLISVVIIWALFCR